LVSHGGNAQFKPMGTAKTGRDNGETHRAARRVAGPIAPPPSLAFSRAFSPPRH
jgi:hypothetical protein